MSYWNHFAECKYNRIQFGNIKIGDVFRELLFNISGKSRGYIVMVKLSDCEYKEVKSGKVHKYFNSELAQKAEVYTYKQKGGVK